MAAWRLFGMYLHWLCRTFSSFDFSLCLTSLILFTSLLRLDAVYDIDDMASWLVLSSMSTRTKSNLQLFRELRTLILIWSSLGEFFSPTLP